MRWLLCLALLSTLPASGLEKEGIQFEDGLKVAGENLVLNGVCLRKARRFGMNFKVYLAGLYLKKKTSVEADILKSSGPTVLRLVFLRSLGKSKLTDAWLEGFHKNCVGDCETAEKGLLEFNNAMADVHSNDRIEMTIQGGELGVTVKTKTSVTKSIKNTAFAANFLRIFLGPEPPTEDCKKELLGTKADKSVASSPLPLSAIAVYR